MTGLTLTFLLVAGVIAAALAGLTVQRRRARRNKRERLLGSGRARE